jgi:phospholipid/cholesterol/gamma-HCH transport system substrate-binding protein
MKSFLNLEIHPSEDKYYLLGIMDDPEGDTKTTEKLITRRTNGGAPTVTEIEEEETEKDGLKFNAQIAKRWGDLALRGGLFESSGGAAVDYYLWDDRLKLYLEAFDFQDDEEPHLKSGFMLYFFKNFYATAGFDDFIGDEDNRSVFGGLGLRFTDDDLKYLLTGVPLPDTD